MMYMVYFMAHNMLNLGECLILMPVSHKIHFFPVVSFKIFPSLIFLLVEYDIPRYVLFRLVFILFDVL